MMTLACPACRSALDASGICGNCRTRYLMLDGIWRLLPADRQAHYSRFVEEYSTVRSREGRGSSDAEYYRALPYADRSGRFTADWRIRARSYESLVGAVIEPIERAGQAPGILDLGAGNGWLSARLAARGHQVAAVDLLTDPYDGLGAFHHYVSPFVPVQAEFDRLPFLDGSVDLVIFNGSLHYSTDYRKTLSEALRVLQPAGRLVVLDSPVYHQRGSGEAMVREREEAFQQRYGFASNALPSENFLTDSRIDQLGLDLGIRWQRISPNYGLAWALRPWRAKLRGRREPARFQLIVGVRGPGSGGQGEWERGSAGERGRERNALAGIPAVSLLPGGPDSMKSASSDAPAVATGSRSGDRSYRWLDDESDGKRSASTDYVAAATGSRSGDRSNQRSDNPSGSGETTRPGEAASWSPRHQMSELAEAGRRNPLDSFHLSAIRPSFFRRAWAVVWLRLRVRLFERARLSRVVVEQVTGRSIVVLPGVFNPRLFRTGSFLATQVDALQITASDSVLDLGTGSGVLAVVAAARAGRVVAIDLNPDAVRCARINALVNDVTVDVRLGDLFEPVGAERFDLVLFNPPFYRGSPRSEADRAWRSEDAVERFAAGLGEHLRPGGSALVVLSTDGETPAFIAAFERAEFGVSLVAEHDFGNERLSIFRLVARMSLDV